MCEKHSEERMEKIHALLQNQYQKFHSENAKEHKEIMQSLEEIKIKIASEYAKKG